MTGKRMRKDSGRTAHDFAFRTGDGGTLPLGAYAGNPLLIVNTASECGFTPQYGELQDLWRRHRDEGLAVLAVPSNDFGGQEPGSDAEIAEFCATRFGVDFPVAAKTRVRGEDAHPFFRWAAEQGGFLAKPRWNFYKYLIDGEGRLVAWFSSLTGPASPRLEAAVRKALRNATSSAGRS